MMTNPSISVLITFIFLTDCTTKVTYIPNTCNKDYGKYVFSPCEMISVWKIICTFAIVYELFEGNPMEALRYDLFLKDVQLFVDQKQIYTDELRTFGWGTDASFYRLIPKIVIRSNGEKQVAKIIQTCAKHKIPYTFRAAGTSLSGQSLSDSVLIVAGKNWEEYEILENGKKIRLQPGIVGGKVRSEEHTSELQSRQYLVCRLLLEK